MRSKKSFCKDPEQLKHRLCVTDNELPYLLGTGATTARKIAKNADAVIYQGKRKLYNVSKIQKYLDQQ